MAKKKIFIQDWLEFKPYDKQVPTDFYYLKICNKVKQAIDEIIDFIPPDLNFDDEGAISLSCFLTSYFEDIISGTNVWNAFVEAHQELYKKPLPFYEVDAYFTEEINAPDIYFLIWYFFNTMQDDFLLFPMSDFIFDMGDEIYDIFDEAWDNSVENKDLKNYYTLSENETDFYKIRNFIDTVLFDTYLFYTDTSWRLSQAQMKLFDKHRENENIKVLLDENKDFFLHSKHTRLLGFMGKEWAAHILKKEHPLFKALLQLSPKISGYFLYKGQDDKIITLEHIASGKIFKLLKKSFDNADKLIDIDTILFIGMVRWLDEWWFSGVYYQQKFNEKLVSKEKNSIEGIQDTWFINQDESVVADVLKRQLDGFLAFNKGDQLAFIETKKIGNFIKEFYEYYNNSLKLADKEEGDIEKFNIDEEFWNSPASVPEFKNDAVCGLVFFNPKSGIEIAFEVHSAFPMQNNPYYDEAESEKHLFHLLVDDDLSKELVMFCIENCKSKLSFLENEELKIYMNDLDFLLRFWKVENYATKPTITLINN